ncbi:hypothetical protein [Aeromonas dhakensis]
MSKTNALSEISIPAKQGAKRLQNLVFRGVHRLADYNACVGENGHPDKYYYAEGFSEAAFTLIENVMNDNRHSIDIFIYPICFNLRHAVELYLKALWDELIILASTQKKLFRDQQ